MVPTHTTAAAVTCFETDMSYGRLATECVRVDARFAGLGYRDDTDGFCTATRPDTRTRGYADQSRAEPSRSEPIRAEPISVAIMLLLYSVQQYVGLKIIPVDPLASEG